MAKLLIKITNVPGDSDPHRIVGGISGREYMFLFDRDLQSYVYEPKDEFEISDIFDLIAFPAHPWRYAPVLAAGNSASPMSVVQVPPIVTPDKYAEHSLPELLALCADCGFVPQFGDHGDAVRAQLNSYFVGRAVAEKALRSASEVASTPAPQPANEPEQSAKQEPADIAAQPPGVEDV